MSWPVTVLADGGMPVSESASGTPMTPTTEGGVPVTIIEDGGMPVTFVDNDFQPLPQGIVGANIILPDSVHPSLTVARAGDTATRIDSSGVLQIAPADTLRYDYSNPNGSGRLFEAGATNLLLNSLLNGANLATQSVTVAATAYTISFYGSGTIELTGVHTETVVGDGAYPTRTTYTFTPTAGSLTCTVSGEVQYAQLETGSFASSFVPTAGSAGVRAADNVSMLLADLPQWNPDEGTVLFPIVAGQNFASKFLMSFNDGTSANRIDVLTGASGRLALNVFVDSVLVANVLPATAIIAGTRNKGAVSFKANKFNCALNGELGTEDTAGAMPVVDRVQFGANRSLTASTFWNGHFQAMRYFAGELTTANLIALTS